MAVAVAKAAVAVLVTLRKAAKVNLIRSKKTVAIGGCFFCPEFFKRSDMQCFFLQNLCGHRYGD